MKRTNYRLRCFIRDALTVTGLVFAVTRFATSQSASPDANPDVLTIRISEDGVCHVLDASTPCDQLGDYLLTNHLAQSKNVHITVDRTSKFELVASTLKSLEGWGFDLGFVNADAPTGPSEPSQPLDVTGAGVTKDGQPIQSHPLNLGAQYYPPETIPPNRGA